VIKLAVVVGALRKTLLERKFTWSDEEKAPPPPPPTIQRLAARDSEVAVVLLL